MSALKSDYESTPHRFQRPQRALTVANEVEGPAEVSLHISVHSANEGDVVVCVGEIDIATAPQLRSTITQLLNAGRNHLIIDLAAVTFLDSAAIEALITATYAAALAGGTLHVTHHPRFMLLLKLTCKTHRVNLARLLPSPMEIP